MRKQHKEVDTRWKAIAFQRALFYNELNNKPEIWEKYYEKSGAEFKQDKLS